MTMTSIPTVPIYIRIPVTLRERLEKSAMGDRSYLAKGAIADTAVKALDAGLTVIDAGDPAQLDMFEAPAPANGHRKAKRAHKVKRAHKAKRSTTKHKARRIAKRSTKRGRK